MILRVLLVSILIIVLPVLPLQASHITGGELYWQCNGNQDYVFTLTIYTHCNPAVMPAGAENIHGPNGMITAHFDTVIKLNENGSCGGACLMEKWVYVSDPVSLSGTPPSTGWDFIWTSCCRPTYQNTSGGASYYLKASMFPYTPPGASNALDASACYDQAPRFSFEPSYRTCQGPFSFSTGPIDADQDSLSVSFTAPLGNSGNPISFDPGYSAQHPFPDSTENSANGPNFVDPHSGVFSLETQGAISGDYVFAMEARAYRDGQLIASAMREAPLTQLDSTSCGNGNNAPNLQLSSNNAIGLSQAGAVYRLTARQGDTIDLQLSATDFDMNSNGTLQTYCLSARSAKLNASDWSKDTGCVGGPCATLVPLSGAYCGTGAEAYDFNWVANCALVNQSRHSRSTYAFHFEVEDQVCPLSKSAAVTLLVDLYPSQSSSPLLSLTGGDTLGRVELGWTPTLAESSSPFDGYVLYHQTGAVGTFMPLDTIHDRDSLQVSYQNLPFPSRFYLQQITGSCALPSQPSDTITSEAILGHTDQGLSSLALNLHPQPAKDHIILESNRAAFQQQAIEVQLYSIRGELLYEGRLNPQGGFWRLPLHQSPGLYLLRASQDGRVFEAKVLVE